MAQTRSKKGNITKKSVRNSGSGTSKAAKESGAKTVTGSAKKSVKTSTGRPAGKTSKKKATAASSKDRTSSKSRGAINRTPKRTGELNFTEDFSTSKGMPQLKTAGEVDLTFPRFENEKQMDQTEICLKCHGCCMYITVPLEYPRSNDQRDLYTWYLLHRNVEIYIDHDKSWAIIFKTPCDKLLANGMCSIYETRPQLCRDYSPDSCSRVGKDHVHLFQTPAEMHAYLDRNKKKSGKKKPAKK